MNSYSDYNMVPDGRPVIAMPTPVTNMIEVPGAVNRLDMSEALTRYPLYSNRQGELNFTVLNNYKSIDDTWASRYETLANDLHGRRLKILLEDDPFYVYEGRFSLNSWETPNENGFSKVVIGYDLDPYKIEGNPHTEQIYIQGGTQTFLFGDEYDNLGYMPTIPIIKATSVAGNMIIKFTSPTNSEVIEHWIYGDGTYKFNDIVMADIGGGRTYKLTVTGQGLIDITTQIGYL